MRAVLDVNPDNATAMNFIGYTLADRGERPRRGRAAAGARAADQARHGRYLDSLGWVYFKQGGPGQAVEVLERAQSSLAGRADHLEHLGDVRPPRGRRSGRPLPAGDSGAQRRPRPADSTTQRSGLEKKLKALSGPEGDVTFAFPRAPFPR